MSTHPPEGKNLEEELSSAPTQVKVVATMSAVEIRWPNSEEETHIWVSTLLCMQERKQHFQTVFRPPL
jgi:hypothetical protein